MPDHFLTPFGQASGVQNMSWLLLFYFYLFSAAAAALPANTTCCRTRLLLRGPYPMETSHANNTHDFVCPLTKPSSVYLCSFDLYLSHRSLQLTASLLVLRTWRSPLTWTRWLAPSRSPPSLALSRQRRIEEGDFLQPSHRSGCRVLSNVTGTWGRDERWAVR